MMCGFKGPRQVIHYLTRANAVRQRHRYLRVKGQLDAVPVKIIPADIARKYTIVPVNLPLLPFRNPNAPQAASKLSGKIPAPAFKRK